MHAFDWLNIRDHDDKSALYSFFEGILGDPVDISLGKSDIRNGKTQSERFSGIFEKARELIEEERFCNWQVMFPGVWSEWESCGLRGGFDAVIGNPPWDRVKLQQVEWFAVRRREIALAARAADRKRMIVELEESGDPLAEDFNVARERAGHATHVARTCGDYPLLSGGDMNLYSLFVERAMTIVKPDGMVGLLVPSGIASDKTSAKFFRTMASQRKLKALYDFENRRSRFKLPPFFPDVHNSFKFCAFVLSPKPLSDPAEYSFFLQDISELEQPDRRFPMTVEDFDRVNPNTGTVPIFRSRWDSELTIDIYKRLPVLVDRSSGEEVNTWPVEYSTMFHMTNDSGLFRTHRELEEKEGAYPIGSNRFGSPAGEWVPLYEGKMVQAFDHRAAKIIINPKNQHRPAQKKSATLEQHKNPSWFPDPQFWVLESKISFPEMPYLLTFKDVTAPTNVRSMIAALIPSFGVANTLPIISMSGQSAVDIVLLLANLNSLQFDYIARQKIQGQHLNWYIVEQLPVIPPNLYETACFGPKTAGEIIREAVLELTYTAHDMAPFARDMGYVDENGEVKPPFLWNEERRLHLRAKLDAVFFHLYGVTDRNDVLYVFSTFPIIERREINTYGGYRSCELCLAYMNALASGNSDAEITL